MGIVNRKPLLYTDLRPEHLDAVMAIEEEAYPEPWTRGMFLEEIRNARSYFYVFFQEGHLAGYGGFWHVLDEAHITSVTVAAHLRGMGMGRDQIIHLLETARVRAIVEATLEVRESNAAARTLYESLGFEQIGKRKGYYSKTGEDALVMKLRLE